jgi:hypothetical protein
MRTIRNVVQTLLAIPRGFPADGRMLGLGLAAAMQAQRDRPVQSRPIRTWPSAPADDYSRAS